MTYPHPPNLRNLGNSRFRFCLELAESGFAGFGGSFGGLLAGGRFGGLLAGMCVGVLSLGVRAKRAALWPNRPPQNAYVKTLEAPGT